jgi:lipopolysaccharide export system ATP-binding protein
VLISDHNVEQTLDIVDRAYIMFDGQVKVSGTVRELVFDDTVADIYLGPTLTARLRGRFAEDDEDRPDTRRDAAAISDPADAATVEPSVATSSSLSSSSSSGLSGSSDSSGEQNDS